MTVPRQMSLLATRSERVQSADWGYAHPELALAALLRCLPDGQLETVIRMAGLSHRSHDEDMSSSWGPRYSRWRPRLRAAHEVAWIGAWFAGGGIALAMGHWGGGLTGLIGGGFFAAISLSGRHPKGKVKANDPCPCGSGTPYSICHGWPSGR